MLGEAEPDEFISLSTAGRRPPLVRASDKINIDTRCHECVYTSLYPTDMYILALLQWTARRVQTYIDHTTWNAS